MLKLREAQPEDAAALAALRYEFRARTYTAVEEESAFVARCRTWMAERLASGSTWRCWVLLDGDVIAGNLWLALIEKVPNPAPEMEAHAYITNVYVRPDLRGAGGGELLVAAAMAWSRDNGIDSAILWPTDRSRSLYERHGFGVHDDLMEAIVNPGRDVH